jgi:predicted PurR-regulated permease PerM
VEPDAEVIEPRITFSPMSIGWIALGVFAALVLVGLLREIPDALTRVGVGVLLAFALDPVVNKVRQRLHCSRVAAVGLVGSLAVGLVAFLIVVLGPSAVRQAERFGNELPQTVHQLYDVPVVGHWLRDANAADRVQQWAHDLPASIDTSTITDYSQRILGGLASALVVLTVGIAVLVDGDRIVARVLAALPPRVEAPAVRAGRIFYRTVVAYFSGSLLVAALASTFILTVGLALGVPLAPAAALWALVVNLIPQVGGFLTGSFFTILGFAHGTGTGLACLVLYLIWMNFENHVLQPAIVGNRVDLSPPTTMLAALIGAAAFGVAGALVATPLCGAAKAIYLEVRSGEMPGSPEHERRHRLRRRASANTEPVATKAHD